VLFLLEPVAILVRRRTEATEQQRLVGSFRASKTLLIISTSPQENMTRTSQQNATASMCVIEFCLKSSENFLGLFINGDKLEPATSFSLEVGK
jgi:hypothetical protein